MKRDKITINDNDVTLTGCNVWMTEWELVELFGTTAGAVNAGIKVIIKNDALNDSEVCKYIRMENGNRTDVYNMEVIIALAFLFNTRNAAVLRKWLLRRATTPIRRTAPIVIQYKEGFIC